LVFENGRPLPAELAVLGRCLQEGEEGVWLNSRSTVSGVVDLQEIEPGKFKTMRQPLPTFVQLCLQAFYALPDVSKGIYDLVLWRESDQRVRFIEVKCPHWDSVTNEQRRFADLAAERGIGAEVVEWEFAEATE
jgi:hypothetical protein